MGYSGIYRVATCCIIVQVVLVSAASALPSSSLNGNGGDSPAIKVQDVVVKEIEDEPSTSEEKNSEYDGTATESEDVKTADGRNKQDAEANIHRETHNEKTTEFSDNKLGKKTDVSGETSSYTDYDGTLKREETKGTGRLKRYVSIDGNDDKTTSCESTRQETADGSNSTSKASASTDWNDNRLIREQFDDRKDDDHVEARRATLSENKSYSRDDDRVTNSYVHENADDLVAVVNEDRTSNTGFDVDKKLATKSLSVSPAGKTSSAQVNKQSTNYNKYVTEHESNVHHESPLHELYIQDLFTDEDVDKTSSLDIETLSKTDTKDKGTTLTHSKTKRDMDSGTLRHKNRFTFEVVPKAKDAQPTRLRLETEILDNDHYQIKETKETDTKSTLPDGGKRAHNLVEETTENYEMHKLEPKKDGKTKSAKTDVKLVVSGKSGAEEKANAESKAADQVIKIISNLGSVSKAVREAQNSQGAGGTPAKAVPDKVGQPAAKAATPTGETKPKAAQPIQDVKQKTTEKDDKNAKTPLNIPPTTQGSIALLVAPSSTNRDLLKAPITFAESMVYSARALQLIGEIVQQKIALVVVAKGPVRELIGKSLDEYVKKNNGALGAAVLSDEKEGTTIYKMAAK